MEILVVFISFMEILVVFISFYGTIVCVYILLWKYCVCLYPLWRYFVLLRCLFVRLCVAKQEMNLQTAGVQISVVRFTVM